jgi:hypothetical protein
MILLGGKELAPPNLPEGGLGNAPKVKFIIENLKIKNPAQN